MDADKAMKVHCIWKKASTRLEGEGQAHCVETQELEAPDHGLEILREAAAAGPQPSHHGRRGLKAEPVHALHRLRRY